MRHRLTLFALAVIIFTSCKKENNTPTMSVMDPVDTSAQLKFSGAFMNGPFGQVSGNAKIFLKDLNYTLVLEGVNISNGPDLHVYLSQEIIPVNFIDLGKLKATAGTQVYTINGVPDFTVYKYALVHCQLFDHLFGSTLLQ